MIRITCKACGAEFRFEVEIPPEEETPAGYPDEDEIVRWYCVFCSSAEEDDG